MTGTWQPDWQDSDKGWTAGHLAGYKEGYAQGFCHGQQEAYMEGFRAGVAKGKGLPGCTGKGAGSYTGMDVGPRQPTPYPGSCNTGSDVGPWPAAAASASASDKMDGSEGGDRKRAKKSFNWKVFHEEFPDANEEIFPRFQFWAGPKKGWTNYPEPFQETFRSHFDYDDQDPGVHQ